MSRFDELVKVNQHNFESNSFFHFLRCVHTTVHIVTHNYSAWKLKKLTQKYCNKCRKCLFCAYLLFLHAYQYKFDYLASDV